MVSEVWQEYANQLKYRRAQPGDKWHLDEAFLTITGRRHYLWRALDQDDNVRDIPGQSRRNEQAAKKVFRKLLKGLLQSYGQPSARSCRESNTVRAATSITGAGTCIDPCANGSVAGRG